MRCPACNVENKEGARNCKKCGAILRVEPIWSPTWQWHLRTLGIIYGCLIVVYFFLNWWLGPYLRDIPPDVTPWLKKAGEIHK